MLSAAHVHGRPTMVSAMISAATSQKKAIQMPPATSHKTLSKSCKSDMMKNSRKSPAQIKRPEHLPLG